MGGVGSHVVGLTGLELPPLTYPKVIGILYTGIFNSGYRNHWWREGADLLSCKRVSKGHGMEI